MKKILNDLLKPRTLFATLFYVTTCYLILRGRAVPQELNTIVSMLLGYYFGHKGRKYDRQNSATFSKEAVDKPD